MPPFLPPRPEGQRYARKAPTVTYSEFPEPVIRRQPPALPPGSRPLELSPPAPIEPPTERTAPGTWREIIARFEADYAETEESTPSETTPPEAAARAAAKPEAAEPEDVRPEAAEPERDDTEPESTTEEPGPFVHFIESAEPAEPVPWEVESMTTPDYEAPRSIHDPEHDSWPVDAQDGDAVPAWESEDVDTSEDESVDAYEDIEELVLDEVVASDRWQDELEPARDAAADFPLDAFIVPAGVQNVPTGYDAEHVAQLVAHRLDVLARELRDGGLGALGNASSVDELSRVLAAIVTGYVARSESK